VKKAFREKAKEFHPDIAKDKDKAQVRKKIKGKQRSV
jgi:DnaJ-class molecular chaperone